MAAVAAKKAIAAFAFPPLVQEPKRTEHYSAQISGAVVSLKVAQLATTLSLAIALMSPSPAGAATSNIIHGAKLFRAECAVCHPHGQNKVNTPLTLQKEALEQYQSLEGPQLVRLVGKQTPHTKYTFAKYFTPLDYDDVIAYVLDQAINNKWDD
jgi:cytochrome c6